MLHSNLLGNINKMREAAKEAKHLADVAAYNARKSATAPVIVVAAPAWDLETELTAAIKSCRSQIDIDAIYQVKIVPILKNAIENHGMVEFEAVQAWRMVKNTGSRRMTEND